MICPNNFKILTFFQICPDTLEEFKYDIEVRPIGLVETIEVNKIDKHHTQPWDGTQNFGVLGNRVANTQQPQNMTESDKLGNV